MPKQENTRKTKRYMLVDGHAIVHRAFHAIQHLSTKIGEPTNAVYGFVSLLLRAIKEIKPTHIAIAFDLEDPTFRHKQYKEYKATRVKAADELHAQVPRIKEVVRSLAIPIFEDKGYEADDVLGTLAEKICEENKRQNFEVLIATGDLDTLQLVNDNVKVYTSRKGLTDVTIYDRAAVKERYGITPEQFVDFKAIKGDPSDNIPGITGIGEKGALDLIKEFGSLENIYKNLDKLKEKHRKLFEEQKEQAQMSYELSKIIRNVPLEYELKPYEFDEVHYQKTVRLFQELEFRSLIDKLPKFSSAPDAVEAEKLKLANNQVKNTSGEDIRQKYDFIDDKKKLRTFVKLLQKQKEFAFDTETDGLGAVDYDLVGLAFSFKEGESHYIPESIFKGEEFEQIKAIMEDPKVKKIAHNVKYDYLVLKKLGIDVQGIHFDTMIASYLLSPGTRTHDLDTAVFNEFGYQMQSIEELIGKGKTQITLKEVDPPKVSWYCGEDVDFTYRLKNLLEPRLEKEKLDKIFYEIEMPLTIVLAKMEANGILLDVKLFADLEKKVAKVLTDLEKKIYKLAGEEFNINSPSQLKVILFEKLKITEGTDLSIKKTKTGYSTAASELDKLQGLHPIIDEIMQYRELSKLQNTYITTLPDQISKTDKRLHTSYSQTIAATGRLSSNNPNLQNIPVGSGEVASEIRKGFIAAPGYTLLSIDYSQIELRLVAHLSEDAHMTSIFNKGEDIHTATAMQLNGLKDPKEVTKEMRRDAKTVNFAVLYGVSSFGLSSRGLISRADAANFIKKYYQAYPGVDLYLKKVIEETKKKGYVENELGRKRYMPEINSSQFMVRAGAERAAINMPVQSLAADIIKIAMNNITKQFDIQSKEMRMLLQVHDELVFEIQKGKEKEYAEKLQKIMQEAYPLRVPLVAEAKVGQSWGDMMPL